MIRLLCVLCLAVWLPIKALAQTVRVTSGDHDGFTRLVLDYGEVVDWQVGRTSDGYEIRLAGATPSYDLTGVYDLIGRGRLAAVWADPSSGALRIGIGCGCHALPFEFRPGIVVIDLKEGPPPKGSSFEITLDDGNLPDLDARPARRPKARPAVQSDAPAAQTGGYDWTAAITAPSVDAPVAEAEATVAAALPEADPDLQPLREALLQQLSRGAARGVVEMAHPEPEGEASEMPEPVRMRLTDMPGLRIDGNTDDTIGLTAEGQTCIADDRLDLGAWGTDRPVAEQMAGAMDGLIGEFDTPDPTAALRAARFLLFAGFGAEARQLLAQLHVVQSEARVLSSLAHILDGSRDPAPVFAGMTACDSAAALWAILGAPAPLQGQAVDRAAALRSFSALPVHLRRLLGPPLADRFIALGDAPAAETVRDAILRAPGDAGPEVALMEARLDLGAGEPAQAEQRLQPLIVTPGPSTPDALIAQVATHYAQRKPLDAEQITGLEALLHERRNSPDAARFALALTQARALGQDFDGAFADLSGSPEAAADVWTLLAEMGPDSALLTHAVLPPGTAPPVPDPVAEVLARRLLDLGFATEANAWLRQVPSADPSLTAAVALQSGDARPPCVSSQGQRNRHLRLSGPEALRRLGDEAALAEALATAGEEDLRWRAVSRARDWPRLAASGPEPWKSVALAATTPRPVEPESPGALAQGQALLQDAQQTRTAVADLLDAVPLPNP